MAGVPEMLALATLGYLMNGKNENKHKSKTRKRTVEKYEPVGQHFVDAEGPDTFNMFSSYQESNTNMLDTIANITDNRKFESCVAGKTCKNEWMKQLEPLTFDNKRTADPSNTDYIARIDMERDGFSDFNLTADGTYGIVKTDSNKFFQPGVMPVVRRGPHPINEQAKAEVNNQKLELFTGVNNADWLPKQERKPLFDPSVNKTDIYGLPPITDFEEKRVNISSERRNERPFEPIQVTPGLNLKSNDEGKQGFHDPFRPLYRTTDELRTANNPKKSYPSYYPPAGNSVSNRPKIGIVTQYSPTHYTGRHADDVVRSGVSEYSAPAIHGEVNPLSLATQNRGTKITPAMGPAKSDTDGVTPASFRGKYHPSVRQNFVNAPPTNVAHHEGMRGAGHNNTSAIPVLTNRSMTEVNPYRGAVAAFAQEKTRSFNPNNIFDPTERNTYETKNYYGQIAELTKQTTPINYSDTPAPTGRNLIESFTSGGFVGPDIHVGKAVDHTDIPNTTIREITGRDRYGAQLTGISANTPAVNYDDVHDINIKTTTEVNRYGGALSGERENFAAINYSDVPQNTIRSITSASKNFGNIGAEVSAVRSFNTNDVPESTIREQTGINKTSGTLTGNKQGNVIIDHDNIAKLTVRSLNPYQKNHGPATGHYGGIAVNPEETTKLTMRNFSTQNKHVTNVTGDRLVSPSVNLDTYIMPPTLRDMHIVLNRAGIVASNVPQTGRHDKDYTPLMTERAQRPGSATGAIGVNVDHQVPRDKYEHMMVNDGKEALEERPSPTQVGQDKGWSINMTTFHFRQRDNPQVVGLPESNIMYNCDRLGFENTVRNKALPDTMRNATIPIELVLKRNPFINNALHRSLTRN